MMRTKEGGRQYEHTLDHGVEFFSKAGSVFANTAKGRKPFYQGAEAVLSLFQKVWIVDEVLAMKLLLWLRDCRGGSGNRSGARECLKWLSSYAPEWVAANAHQIPVYGRWDDLTALFGTSLEGDAAGLWSSAIREGNVLAAKWADRKMTPIQRALSLNEAELRKLLSALRKKHIVEHKMCQKRWDDIEFQTVPSVAMARYNKAFRKHAEERFAAFMEKVSKGEAKIHADVLFPHDCVRTALSGDREVADAQFNALPNFLAEADERPIVISDTSGSMRSVIAGSVEAIHVSQGLALYCSAMIPADNPFYKKFVAFCSEGKFVDWNGMTFSEAVHSRKVFDRAVGSTRIDKALDLILDTAKFFGLPQEKMPTMLIIASDMQFHQGVTSAASGSKNNWYSNEDTVGKEAGAEVEIALGRWTKAGYKIPKIIYWNLDGFAGAPATIHSQNVGLVSGFSTSVLKALFDGTDLTPKGVMMRTLEKYEVVKP